VKESEVVFLQYGRAEKCLPRAGNKVCDEFVDMEEIPWKVSDIWFVMIRNSETTQQPSSGE
jgi:hypothetical protein